MKFKATKYDILLIVAILFISIYSLFNSYNRIADTNKMEVSIYLDTKLYKQFTLTDTLDETINVKGEVYENTIRIKDGQVWVTHSTCPDSLCERHTPISSPGQIIVCLPNKMIVEIKGEENKNQPDSISQ